MVTADMNTWEDHTQGDVGPVLEQLVLIQQYFSPFASQLFRVNKHIIPSIMADWL